MESSIIENSITNSKDLQEAFANAIYHDFLGSLLHTLFLSPVSIFVYGAIAILIIRIIIAKRKGNKK